MKPIVTLLKASAVFCLAAYLIWLGVHLIVDVWPIIIAIASAIVAIMALLYWRRWRRW
jgi:hypothetical protein